MGNMRFVLDTDVAVAALRSPQGASAELLRLARREDIILLANVALALEYEATCSRAEHGIAAGLTTAEVQVFLDAVIAMVEPVPSHFLWRPMLRDPSDEMVLEAAVNGGASAIVTFNRRDFSSVPSQQFGIEVMAPRDALKRIRR